MSASRRNAWPAQLGRLSRKRVYNLALGSYCPAHYHHLLSRYAFILNPAMVIVGFYVGNDLHDTFRYVYGKPQWASWRKPDFRLDRPIRHVLDDHARGVRGIRAWLMFLGLIGDIWANSTWIKMEHRNGL